MGNRTVGMMGVGSVTESERTEMWTGAGTGWSFRTGRRTSDVMQVGLRAMRKRVYAACFHSYR